MVFLSWPGPATGGAPAPVTEPYHDEASVAFVFAARLSLQLKDFSCTLPTNCTENSDAGFNFRPEVSSVHWPRPCHNTDTNKEGIFSQVIQVHKRFVDLAGTHSKMLAKLVEGSGLLSGLWQVRRLTQTKDPAALAPICACSAVGVPCTEGIRCRAPESKHVRGRRPRQSCEVIQRSVEIWLWVGSCAKQWPAQSQQLIRPAWRGTKA